MMNIQNDPDDLRTLERLAKSLAQLLEWREVYQSIGNAGARKKFVQIVSDLAEKGSAEAQDRAACEAAVAWAEQFKDDLSAIAADLPLRTYFALRRALDGYIRAVSSPSAGDSASYKKEVVEGAFSVRGTRLSFDEWCEAVQTGKVNVNELEWLDQIGPKSLDAIRLAAIKHSQRRIEQGLHSQGIAKNASG